MASGWRGGCREHANEMVFCSEIAWQPRSGGRAGPSAPHLAVLLALILLAAGAAPVTAEPNDGTVSGQVVNKTAGGGSTAGATVTLVSFGRKEQAPLGQRTAQTDADGRYSFTDLDRDPNIVYLTLARFPNVNYPTDQPFQPQDPPGRPQFAKAFDLPYNGWSVDVSMQNP